jgi:nucleoside-diphosphate-sugar epimerase
MIETVTSDLKVLKSKDKKPARVLVTGATGYVGGRLVRELVAHKYRVRVLVRDAHNFRTIRGATRSKLSRAMPSIPRP